jgi:hypothetical protein
MSASFPNYSDSPPTMCPTPHWKHAFGQASCENNDAPCFVLVIVGRRDGYALRRWLRCLEQMWPDMIGHRLATPNVAQDDSFCVTTTGEVVRQPSRLTTSQRAARSAHEAAERLEGLQRNMVRAQLFAANAHNRAAQAHERAAAGGIGDVDALKAQQTDTVPHETRTTVPPEAVICSLPTVDESGWSRRVKPPGRAAR